MISKKYLLITAVLGFLAGLSLFWQGGNKPLTDAHIGKPVLAAKQQLNVDHVTFTRGATSLQLGKNADGLWMLESSENFPADATKIASFFDALGRVNYQRLIPGAKKATADLGLDHTTDVVLKAAGNEVLKLKLGDARSGGGQYAQLKDDDVAYLLSDKIDADLDGDPWENKVLVNVKKEDLKKVEFFDEKKQLQVVVERDKAADPLAFKGVSKDAKLKPQISEVEQMFDHLRFNHRRDVGNVEAKMALANTKLAKIETFDGRVYQVASGNYGPKAKEVYFLKVTLEKSPDIKEQQYLDQLMAKWAFEVSGQDAKKFQIMKK